MDINTSGEVAARIDARPESVYSLVSDITRTGEWSPECQRCRWVDRADEARPGARFRGWNRSGLIRWSRLVEVVAAEPGREFAFRTVPDRVNRDSTTWRYHIEPDGDGTLLTESYAIHSLPQFPVSLVLRLFLRHHADMRPHMRVTLERIKAVAESTVPSRLES
jgi:Polyketide cyclase / dehydrase and lipid transport